MPILDREDTSSWPISSACWLSARVKSMATQDLLKSVREEILATTKLPMAIDFLASESRLVGVFAPAMARLPHLLTTFQTYVVEMAERRRGRFDFSVALAILEREAAYRAAGVTQQGIFLYQFECLCRNRLGYDRGLDAIAGDPLFDGAWREWITIVKRQIGIIDFCRSDLRPQRNTTGRRRHAPVTP